MAPLPVNNTLTAWLQYTSEGVQHEMEARFAVGVSGSDAATRMRAIAALLAPLMYTTDSATGVRVRAAGSNLSFPQTFAPVTGTGSGSAGVGQEPNFFSLSGRSSGGRRCRMTFFSPFAEPNDRYRFSIGEIPTLDNWLDYVSDPLNEFVAIDGQPVVWNQYINTGTNSYWQREMRRG